MTIQPGMDLGQTICNNSVGAFDPIIYNLDNALTVNVNWTPNRPTGLVTPIYSEINISQLN